MDKSGQKMEFLDYVESYRKPEPDINNDLILNNVTAIRDKFIDEIAKEGVKVQYYPEVEVVNALALMSFRGDRNFGYLLTPYWATLDQNIKKLFQSWLDKSEIVVK